MHMCTFTTPQWTFRGELALGYSRETCIRTNIKAFTLDLYTVSFEGFLIQAHAELVLVPEGRNDVSDQCSV